MDASSGEPGTRDKILIAAATMLAENPTARLSVRAVAARAEVSTGSLRHFFPTQRSLIDTVIAGFYEVDVPDDPMGDRTKTASERLLEGMRLLLSHVGTGDRARQQFGALYDAYVATPPAADQAETYLAIERLGRHRIERWLEVLVDEGAISPGATERQARFLSTVLNGLMMERALPSDAVRVETEIDTLRLAVHAVVTSSGPSPPDDTVRA